MNCSRTLDSFTFNSGSDGEIYCKNCYQEQFGTLSRRSRSRTMSRAESRAASRSRVRSRSGSIPNLDSVEGHRIMADSIINTTSIKAKEGDKDACPRCLGKVFEAEKMMTRYRVYHRKCFTCEECKVSSCKYQKRFRKSYPTFELKNNLIFLEPYFSEHSTPVILQKDQVLKLQSIVATVTQNYLVHL